MYETQTTVFRHISLNYLKAFPIVIIWDFVIKCVSCFSTSYINEYRIHPEKRPGNFSPRTGPAGTSQSPAKANAKSWEEQPLARGKGRADWLQSSFAGQDLVENCLTMGQQCVLAATA